MTTKSMTQAAYAKHRSISPARVSTMIKDGKIPPSCYEIKPNGRRLIDVAKADKALSENLDQLYNPRRKPTAAQIKAQDEAADFASVEDEDGKWLYPQPWWELRYLVKMLELSPDQVETFRYEGSKAEYLIKMVDYCPDEPEPSFPWSVELKFTFGRQ